MSFGFQHPSFAGCVCGEIHYEATVAVDDPEMAEAVGAAVEAVVNALAGDREEDRTPPRQSNDEESVPPQRAPVEEPATDMPRSPQILRLRRRGA